MATELDKIDLKILRTLQEDASRSAAEIAEAVGLSQSPCWRRIQRLKDEGYISKIVAVLDRDKLDLRAQFFVQVKVAIRRAGQKTDEPTDISRVVNLLRDAKYQGYVALEYESADPWGRVPGYLEQLRKAIG